MFKSEEKKKEIKVERGEKIKKIEEIVSKVRREKKMRVMYVCVEGRN
jgi:hypothetical protein